ncbi:MAG: CRISPR-associated endonuclease Cas2 [Acidobacteria bacterium]|nr:CRISPR-associated endonuclease Cas2 [Acidobacteriota bacterium]
MWVVISYDISSDKRRTKIFEALKSYGQHVQYSVFECDLSKQAYAKLRHRLDALISKSEGDSIRYYFLCEGCAKRIERIGGPQPMSDEAEFV